MYGASFASEGEIPSYDIEKKYLFTQKHIGTFLHSYFWFI